MIVSNWHKSDLGPSLHIKPHSLEPWGFSLEVIRKAPPFCVVRIQEQLQGSPIWSEELAATLAEVRGLTGGLMNHGAIQNQEAGKIAVRITTRVGQRLGVKGSIFQNG